MQNPGMVVSDLDGTLTHPSGQFTDANLIALRDLGERGFLRAVATGRSLFSARQHLPPSFPIDYLIFSSGAGILDWQAQQVLTSRHLLAGDIDCIREVLVAHRLDFMIHDPIPDNHLFAYWQSGGENPDFERRLSRQALYCRKLTESTRLETATQFLAVVRGALAETLHAELSGALPAYNVIRATSPIDRESGWLEVFPAGVSKATAAAWLAGRNGMAASHVLAVGNDYNDWDLLRWAASAFVVGDAPEVLRKSFPVVASHEHSGFAQAVEKWLSTLV